MNPLHDVRAVCFDWGGTLMSEDGPAELPMALWPRVQALDGAADALRLLAGRLPLAIATNAAVSDRRMIERALSRVGLDRYVDHVFCFTELGCRKDQPAFWAAVAATLGCAAQHIAMVGDSLDQDARGPRACGVQGVWLCPAGEGRDDAGVPCVDDLRRFAQWVLAARAQG